MLKNKTRLRLGLDIDGTITGDPEFFAGVCQEVLRLGEVHVVSSRSPEAVKETVEELADLGIVYTAIFLLPPISLAQFLCPYRELDWYQRHQWLKVNYALENELTHFVDDDYKVLRLFSLFAPSIAAMPFKQRKRLLPEMHTMWEIR